MNMSLYEIAKVCVVCGCFGAMLGLIACWFGQLIHDLVGFIRKKLVAHKEKKVTRQHKDH